MHLLPYERLVLRVASPPEAVTAKLTSLVSRRRFTLVPPPEPFRGWIKGRRFKLVRVRGAFLGLEMRNSWRPIVLGELAPVPEGTEIRVRMRLSIPVGVFSAAWFTALLVVFTMVLAAGLKEGFGPRVTDAGQHMMSAGLAVGILGAMMLAAFGLVSVSFRSEVRRARRALCEGLGCQEVDHERRLVRG
jgi:hypothetical protein